MNPILAGFSDEILKLASVLSRHGVRLKGRWSEAEASLLDTILGALPRRLVRGNKNLKSIGRAKKLIGGPPGAPGHSMYKPVKGKHGGTLVIFDKGVYDLHGKIDAVLFGKSVLHELSHSFDDNLPIAFGKPPFITEYAATSPKEDWAESFAEFYLHPKLLKRKAPRKYEAIDIFTGD